MVHKRLNEKTDELLSHTQFGLSNDKSTMQEITEVRHITQYTTDNKT